jgi:putative ABC transport system permease protein
MTKRTTMPFSTALKTSANNLLTKKGRTLITSLAGSIGIIGIALVLSISQGMTTYVGNLQGNTLAGFPISIPDRIPAFGPPVAAQESEDDFPSIDKPVSSFSAGQQITNFNRFTQEFIDYLDDMNPEYYNAITYSYAMPMNVLTVTSGNTTLIRSFGSGSTFAFSRNLYEMPSNETFILSQYDLLKGRMPTQKDEMILVVDKQNRIDQSFFTNFGIIVPESGIDLDNLISPNPSINPIQIRWIPNNLLFSVDEAESTNTGRTIFKRNDVQTIIDRNGQNNQTLLPLKVVGVLRIKPSASGEILTPGLAYTSKLTDFIYGDLEQGTKASTIVNEQLSAWNDETNLGHNVESNLAITSKLNFTARLRAIGGEKIPTSAQIYPSSFENKDLIKAYINNYNYDGTTPRRDDLDMINYSDLAEDITSTITDLINTIAIVLTAFASISLLVSSIMIGIITYVSVIERTKEIGIMRSLGARKKDIARIFNAETILIGFVSGVLGVTITLLLNIPINIIILNLIEVANFTELSPLYATGLILLSTFLTLLAGLIPSGIAARKDPVIALRTE